MLSDSTIKTIENTIATMLEKKLKNYKPTSESKPFHTRLLGKDRMALFSFIQSINTSFGMSIFEAVAKTIAKSNFKLVKINTKLVMK